MNKIFKVVWSKTKECYVVVSEVAKNNGGKKKVLASVLAGLAMVSLAGVTAQAADMNTDKSANTANQINIWANTLTKGNPANGGSNAPGSGVANANDVKPSQYGDEISIAIGGQNSINTTDTTSPGSGGSGYAIGNKNKIKGNRNVALGTENKTYGDDSIAIGNKTVSGTGHGIAIGSINGTTQTVAYGSANPSETASSAFGFALAIGSGAQADGRANGASGGIAIGQLVKSTNNNTVAIGVNTTASGNNAVAIGSGAQATQRISTAYGPNANANSAGGVAIGTDAAVGTDTGLTTVIAGATAVGANAKAQSTSGSAFGRNATADKNAENATALGAYATANIAGGVALGSESKTTKAAGETGYNPATGRTNDYNKLTNNTKAALTSTRAAVSIGDDSASVTRQLTGLAAGTQDTDAVNVAQLKAVNLKFAGDSTQVTGSTDVRLNDGTFNVNGDGTLISTEATATGIKVKAKVGGTINNTDGKAVKPTTNGIATTDNVVDAINDSYWKATAGGNTDGTPSVGNVKPGTQVTYSAGDNLKVKQTIAANGNQEYKYSLNPVLTGITSIANTATGPKMTFGGNSINITGGSLDMGNNKITNLATGTDDKDAVNVKQLKDTEIHITPGTYTPDSNKKVTLTYENGDNKTVAGKTAVIDLSGLATGGTASTESVVKKAAATGDTNIADVSVAGGKAVNDPGAQYEVSVSKNAVKDAAREAVTVNNGGNTDNPISVTPTQDNTNHNTTYEVTFDGNKAAKQIPLTYKATNGTITTADQTVKLDKGLNFTGGDYTTASVGADGKVTFDVNLGTAPTVTDGKPGVPGQAGAAGKDGIATVKTVVDTINNSGWKANAKANGGKLDGNSTATVVKPGDQVNFAAGKNLTVKQDLTGEHTYTYSLNKDIDLTNAGSLTVGDTTVNNGGITIKAPTPAAGTTATTTDVKLTNTGLDNGGNKIVNVAEGTADTDAVNVKQLKDAKTVLADGKNTKKSGTGTAADPYKVNVEGDLTGISSITNDGTNNGKISFGPNKTVTVDGDHSITLNASTGKIGGLQNLTFDPTNFTSGQAATEDQLKSVHDTLKASELHIAPTESNRTGEHIAGAATSNTAAGAAANAYKYDATTKQVVLEYNDGTGANKTGTKAVIDFSALNTGGTTASTWTAKTSAENTTAGSEVGKHAGDTSQVIGDQNSVDFQAGKNMTVKQTNDGNGNTTINYALDKNLDVESVHVGKDGKDGKIGIDGKDGVDGLDGTNRVDIHVEKGAKGVDGTDGHDGVNGHNGKDGMTRIVYEDKGGKQEVATLNDGMKYAGDDAQGTDKTKVIAKKLNETLDIIGGANKADLTTDNIGVNNDGNGKLLVQLSKNLKGINTIKNGNTTITLNDTPSTTTPAVTITGGNLSLGDGTTNNKIVNVAPGTDDTDAVNVKQLKDAKTVLADGKNTKKSGTGTAADPYKVNVEGDLTEITSITNKADASGNNAGKITFSPNQTVTVSGDHNISLNGKTGDITGLTNTTIPTTAGSDFATKGRAATEEQLKIVNDKFNNKINLGADTNETTKFQLDNASGIKFNIKGDGSGTGGANQYISTTANGSNVNVDLTADAKAKLNKTYTVSSGSTNVTVTPTTTGDNTDFKITVASTGTTTSSSWNLATDKVSATEGTVAAGSAATQNIADTKTVTMQAGKNLTVKQTNDTAGNASVAYSLDKDISVETVTVTGQNGKDGKIGIDGKDGVDGKDGKNRVEITVEKGAKGVDGTDGHDGVNGHNGKDGMTRIVYEDKGGKQEVATLNDGMKYAGDDAQGTDKTKVIAKKLNETLDIIGGANKADLTTDNIGVNNDGNGKLLVQLSKNLKGINTIKNGNTTITLNDTPSTTTPAVTITGGNLSLGDGTTNNKIVNVAPGTDDTDAVNVKQLKDAKTVLADGKNTKKSGTGTAADPYKVNVEGDLTDITSITNKADASGNAGKITFSPNQTVTVNGDHNITLDAGSGHIGGLTNLTFNPNSYTSGQAATEDQLKSVHDTLKANERHIAPTTVATGSTETKGGTANAAGTANVYKYDAASKTVTLTYNDGNGNAVTDTKAVIDLSNLSTGGTGASSWNVKSSANTTDGGAVDANHNANAQNIADGKSVEFQSGKNLVVKQTNDTTNGNATVEFSLADNIVAGKDGANGKDGSVGATGKDGSSVVLNGKDGSIGMTGPKGQDGKDGINGRDGADISITSAKGEQVLVNRDPAHNSDTDKAERIVYVPKDASGNPIQDANGKNIVREVATMDDGLRFTGNNTGTENKRKLGSLVKVQGEDVSAADEAAFQSAGGNIAVTADGTDTLTIRLNKNLKGLNSIQLGDNTIKSNGDNIEFTTKGGDTKTVATTDQLWTIQANGVDVPAKSGKVNLVAGDHITITPDAANGKMTISATGFGSMDGFNVKTSADANGTHAGDTTENIKNGKTVDMQAGKNLVVTQSNDGNGNTTVNYALNKDVDLGTNGSLKTGDTTINNDGFKNGNTTVGGNGMTINNPTDPAKTVSLTKDGLNNGGNQITNVASGGNTDTNGANIGDVKRIAKAGDTRIKDDTYTVDNTGTVELTYVDGAGKQVTDAAGNPLKAKITGITTLDSTRVNVAVNKTGTGEVAGSTAPVKVTKGTEFVAGNNLIVERKAHTGNDLDNSVVYSLNSNLTGINSISNTTTGPKMTFGGNSINVTNGDLNMGGNKITNLAPGKDKTDAATVGQLTKVTSNNHSVVINKTTDADGAPVYDLAVTGTPGAPAADPRVDMLGEEIGRVGAQGAALSALKPIQYDPLEPTQIMAGYGNYRGNSALALGVAHYKNESTLIHGGVSWAGGSSHMMANAGVTWKVGNRDSEAAVADRYRKGPISSAYAMQQEMASVKAQNAGLKSEVSDLKAENEQMKAQIAAMMAKLGM